MQSSTTLRLAAKTYHLINTSMIEHCVYIMYIKNKKSNIWLFSHFKCRKKCDFCLFNSTLDMNWNGLFSVKENTVDSIGALAWCLLFKFSVFSHNSQRNRTFYSRTLNFNTLHLVSRHKQWLRSVERIIVRINTLKISIAPICNPLCAFIFLISTKQCVNIHYVSQSNHNLYMTFPPTTWSSHKYLQKRSLFLWIMSCSPFLIQWKPH